MPTRKTYQAGAKRLRITKNKKVVHRTTGQDHFNSRESGSVTKGKRRHRVLSSSYTRSVKTMFIRV